jgi:hypothetical protein
MLILLCFFSALVFKKKDESLILQVLGVQYCELPCFENEMVSVIQLLLDQDVLEGPQFYSAFNKIDVFTSFFFKRFGS